MKRFAFIIPVLIFLLFMSLGNKVLATGTVSPSSLVIIVVVAVGLILFMKPKTKVNKPATDIEVKARGDFAKDAFADKPQLEAKFQAAIKDYNSNMPKAALAKLTKLAPLCTDDKEIYAVSMATAQVQMLLGKPLPAIREYTRALGLHPTTQGAIDLGSCHQRMGNLDKARDSYEFALDLDPDNLEARAILATTYVADGDYYTALEQAQMVLEKNDKHASALATAAISCGLTGDPVMCKHYTTQAVENGYSKKKIEETIAVLKKR
ncbi:MAG: hypothetical protein U0N82_06295 [Oscillospiraceae bacterium]